MVAESSTLQPSVSHFDDVAVGLDQPQTAGEQISFAARAGETYVFTKYVSYATAIEKQAQASFEYPPAPVPDRPSHANLREALQRCRACDLWEGATQAVLGEGAWDSEVMMVGEQPGRSARGSRGGPRSDSYQRPERLNVRGHKILPIGGHGNPRGLHPN